MAYLLIFLSNIFDFSQAEDVFIALKISSYAFSVKTMSTTYNKLFGDILSLTHIVHDICHQNQSII